MVRGAPKGIQWRSRPRRYPNAHWRRLRMELGMRMRKPLIEPAYQIPPRFRYRANVMRRQRREAQAAFLTPYSP
ncbi:MAG: hypothetical protein JXB14_07495 [Candidatus Altiarchaeota archaeon]|nr:hypothetical protein [Candidatus Altiarchaeota archaeon]